MNNCEKAHISIETAIKLLYEKSPESALAERFLLLADAWGKVKVSGR